MSTSEPRRVSASRLASIEQCTMQYYLKEVLDLPEKVWARTSAGTVTHGILECLYRDKHRAHHDLIKTKGTIYASRAVTRLLRAWTHHLGMPPDIVADIDAMCMVAINSSDFLDEGATKRFEPEHEFKLVLENGAVLKGIIDRMAEFGEIGRVSDWKSARNKKTKAEVLNSYQSLCYQLYYWMKHGKLAEVVYYFLRHAPTKMTPKKHIMVTPPATESQLRGFAAYVQYMYEYINAFGIEEAHSGYCQDQGFCDRVCSYRVPFTYLSVTKKGSTDKSRRYWIDPKTGAIPYVVKPDEDSEILSHGGCPRFNAESS